MHRVSLLIAFSLLSATVYGQEPKKPSPEVKKILDKAIAEVKKNRQEFDKANETPLGDAKKALAELSTKLIKGNKAIEAGVVLKQIETLEADVLKMANASEPPRAQPRGDTWSPVGAYNYQQTDGWTAKITIHPNGAITYHDKKDHPGTWTALSETELRITFHTGAWVEARKGDFPGTLIAYKTHDGKSGVFQAISR